jgi:hypothetical protein
MKSNMNNLFSLLIYVSLVLILIITVLLVLGRTRENFDNHSPSNSNNESLGMSNDNSYSPGMFNDNMFENSDEDQAEEPIEMESSMENFIRYPGLQMFCTVLKGNLSSMWGKLPESIANGLYVKTCCPMCFEKISESLCSQDGEYLIEKMTATDVDNIKAYHTNQNLDFELDEDTLNGLINSDILKMVTNNSAFPVQVLRRENEISSDDFINTSLKYEC